MKNPWNNIDLNDYENHMKLQSVLQLQTMNKMMKSQLYTYKVSTVMILGIAGGNGLNHINKEDFLNVYGVDINNRYLWECAKRYPDLKDVFIPINVDLTSSDILLPRSELVIANLLIEYIGYDAFINTLSKVKPKYVSCIIQINTGNDYVSDSPYLHTFDKLNEVYNKITEQGLTCTLENAGYKKNMSMESQLPNGKKLLRIDYEK